MKQVGIITSKVVMGIDPGTNKMGYGVIRCHGKDAEYVTMGYIAIPSKMTTYQKLGIIFEKVDELIALYMPEEVAYEAPFFGENVQSMLKLGRAQGVAMAAALHREVPVFEYAPRRIKQSVTGVGGAAKEQVASMLKSMLGVEYNPKRLDATDGLAVALCHYFVTTSPLQAEGTHPKSGRRGSSGSWEEFVARNPEREIKARRKK